MAMDKLKPRQLDIMQNLAKMLQAKGPVKVTTASLASECGITEAAIYRHFPSKKKIYEGLVDFCEQSLFDLIGDINSSNQDHLKKASNIIILLVSFSEKNPGLARLLTREAFSVDGLRGPITEKLQRAYLDQVRGKRSGNKDWHSLVDS